MRNGMSGCSGEQNSSSANTGADDVASLTYCGDPGKSFLKCHQLPGQTFNHCCLFSGSTKQEQLFRPLKTF